ncbi:hypothetical protein N0V82_010420 [Gnomoniopsis sp. IMI 355080]|nr:hypothetical protein N0V82_010420 [Gnomoniopsis sp. IMI 355080]
MTTRPPFQVREAESSFSDDKFVVAAFDSSLPYLASIGSQEMWGSTPFSERDGWAAETSQQVQDAETFRLTGQGEALRIFVVEAEVLPDADGREVQQGSELNSRVRPEDGKRLVAVGFAFVREDWVPPYVASQEHLVGELAGADSCLYIEAMVADYRVSGPLRKGSGSALVQAIKEYGLKTQRRALFVDGWAGNDRKLVRLVLDRSPIPVLRGLKWLNSYYTRQGFRVVGDFSLARKDKAPWLGTLLRMQVQ